MVLRGEKGKVKGLLHFHVDDILRAGDEEFEKKVDDLTREIQCDRAKAWDFEHLGMRIRQNKRTMEITVEGGE